MIRPLAFVALAALSLAACSKPADDAPTSARAPIAAVPPPAGSAWVDVVNATPEGGYRMGNPNAPVQLVEYGSLTCPHCKLFAGEGLPIVKRDYIAAGRVSYEFRPFLIHSPDPMATLLVECRGPRYFFPMMEQVFAAQDIWLGKLVAVPEKRQEAWTSLAPVDQFHAMADASGLKGFLVARGLTGADADKCLADPLGPSKLVGIRDHATNDLGVNGTPTFFINGQIVDNASAWAQLEPRLKDAVG